jgi:hypothetical protein
MSYFVAALSCLVAAEAMMVVGMAYPARTDHAGRGPSPDDRRLPGEIKQRASLLAMRFWN